MAPGPRWLCGVGDYLEISLLSLRRMFTSTSPTPIIATPSIPLKILTNLKGFPHKIITGLKDYQEDLYIVENQIQDISSK